MEAKLVIKMIDSVIIWWGREVLVDAAALALGHASLAVRECWVAIVTVAFLDAIGPRAAIPQAPSHAV